MTEELSRSVFRQVAQMTSARSCQVEEFLQRKQEAMLNKFRAEGQLVSRVLYCCHCPELCASLQRDLLNFCEA